MSTTLHYTIRVCCNRTAHGQTLPACQCIVAAGFIIGCSLSTTYFVLKVIVIEGDSGERIAFHLQETSRLIFFIIGLPMCENKSVINYASHRMHLACQPEVLENEYLNLYLVDIHSAFISILTVFFRNDVLRSLCRLAVRMA